MSKVLFYPYANRHVVPRRAPDTLVEEWSKLVEVEALRADESIDLEHWIESACLLKALVKVLGRDRVELADEDISTQGRVVFGPMPKFRALSERQLWPDPASDKAALRYHVNPAFPQLARRWLATVDFPDDDGQYSRPGHSLKEALAKFKDRGHERVLLKYMAAPKTLGLLEFDFEEDSLGDILDWLGYEEINHPGAKDAILLQEVADVQFEFRFFVVDGEVATGSGQIDELTPLARNGWTKVRGLNLDPPARTGVFYPWAARTRDSDDIAMPNYYPFENYCVKHLCAADPNLRDFTLDVATINGKPGIVELNPIGTSGFFASSPEALVKAVMRTVEKGR